MIVYRELSTLEKELGFSAKTLYAVSNDLAKHYRKAELSKPGGGVRRLTVPDDLLKSIQRSIAENLLIHASISPYATAYRYGGSTAKNASCHIGRKMVLKLDIKNFFDSILYSQVKDMVFPEDIYSEPLRVLLTMLCYYKDFLPQGAPSSPAITNIIMADFDFAVGAWCASRNIHYTRYCDDMSFSGDFDAGEVIDFVSAQLKKKGLFLNPAKTKLQKSHCRQCITGIVVNKKSGIPVEYRRRLRQELYYCKKFGVQSHLLRSGIEDDAEKYLLRLLGRVSHVLSISPGSREMQEYKNWILNEIKKTY